VHGSCPNVKGGELEIYILGSAGAVVASDVLLVIRPQDVVAENIINDVTAPG
jgi:hypothetical protein